MRRHQIVLIAVLVGGISIKSEARKRRTTSGVTRAPIVFASSDEVFRAVAATYGVPEGLLRCIWKKESSELASGWRNDSADWFRARSLIRQDGECFKRYALKTCQDHWHALVALCAQRYKSGSQK